MAKKGWADETILNLGVCVWWDKMLEKQWSYSTDQLCVRIYILCTALEIPSKLRIG